MKKFKIKISPIVTQTKQQIQKAAVAIQNSTAELFSTSGQVEILRYLETLTEGAATLYDKALDKEYIATHIGGGNHRLFDGGHDLNGAWERVKEALPDDTFAQEVVGYVSALWKDVTTLKGLPFATLEKANYEQWADKIAGSIPGVSKEYLYDLLSFDAMELFSSALGAVSIIFALKNDDQKKLSEILASMGISSILSANPIMGIVTIGLTAYSYVVKNKAIDKSAAFKSSGLALLGSGIFAALGLPFLVELVIVFTLTHVLRRNILDNEKLIKMVIKNLKLATVSGTEKAMHIKNELASVIVERIKRAS